MAAVMWIQMSSFLLLMLQITAETTGQTLSSFRAARAGHDITLSCENVIDGQHDCSYTTWMFTDSRNTATVELVADGQIKENVKAEYTRLSVTANCSLLIKKVQAEDVGLYTCRQYKTRGGQQEGPDFMIDLSVINMTEHENNNKVIVNCSVLTHAHCRHTVEWLHEGKNKISDVEIKPGSCSVTVTFKRSHRDQKLQFYNSLKCKVTDDYTKEEKLFPFKLKSSGLLLWLIILPVGLSALLITAVVIRWKKHKGKERQLAGNTAEDDDGVSYISISLPKRIKSKTRSRGHDEGDTVTYSTVKAVSSSAGDDPNHLYSTINDVKK
ncbi:uncharacterized protein LOC120725438 isoform X3 [Simochromis diagramma]|uniref:uncharacterized protein LOC120725438 isoform X3 n=1 Tax=Simochromis diagramma TaxID=43689 RepID=UPI001A7E21F8|nr:uncharacterized protein LOC120725438 isoform X3 [Simochromis diagramma]